MSTNSEFQNIIVEGELNSALRGEVAAFETPFYINANPKPTDHSEMLKNGVYPAVAALGADLVKEKLEEALLSILHDGLGVYCAIQCFYIEILNEDRGISPITIDRNLIAVELGNAFQNAIYQLKSLELQPDDMQLQRPYRVTVSRMRILEREHHIKWPFSLSSY